MIRLPRAGERDPGGPRAGPDLWSFVTTVFLAASFDLGLSTLHGYKLVRPLWPLPPPLLPVLRVVVIEVIVVGSCAAACLLAFDLTARASRLERWLAPARWARVVTAALAPVVLWRAVIGLDAAALLFAALGALGVAAIAAVEVLRFVPGPGRLSAVWAGCVLALTVALAVALPALELGRVAPTERLDVPRSSEDSPNLVVIVLDTVRADHLGLYGYPRNTTPFLDRLGAHASVFEEAVAASSYTLPSHASLFTGLHPQSHGAIVSEEGTSLDELGLMGDRTRVIPLAPAARTLAEILRDAGFETGAVGANLAYLSPEFGLGQGFDAYIVPTGGWSTWQPAGVAIGRKLAERLPQDRWAFWYRSRVSSSRRFYLLASEVNALALRWLESRRDGRFFLFLNYMDAHAPYLPLPGYRDLFPASDTPQSLDREAVLSGRRPILPSERQPLVDAYDAELRYLDDRLEELFDQLEAWDLQRRTVVVVVGDHGESFGEHGEFEHASGLYQTQLHVPLIVRRPAQQIGERVARRVHLVDVLPTALELVGVEVPGDLDGSSLWSASRRSPITAHLGPYGGARPRDALYRDSLKLLADAAGGPSELYDLASDAGELRDLASEESALLASLEDEMERFKRAVTPRFSSEPADVEAATRARLEALGYAR